MAKKIEDLLREAKVGSLKRPATIEVSRDLLVEEAIKIMQRERSGYVVATDENKKVVGIFTEKDLALYVFLKEPDFKVPILNYIKFPLRALTLNDSVGQAIDLMHTYEYRHVAIIDDNGGLVGVLSARSIIRFLAEHFPTEVLNLPPRSTQGMITREGG